MGRNIDSGEICPNLWIRCEAKTNIWGAIAHTCAANRRCMKYQKVIQMIFLEMQINQNTNDKRTKQEWKWRRRKVEIGAETQVNKIVDDAGIGKAAGCLGQGWEIPAARGLGILSHKP